MSILTLRDFIWSDALPTVLKNFYGAHLDLQYHRDQNSWCNTGYLPYLGVMSFQGPSQDHEAL